MIRQMLAVDGILAVCQFRDDGAFVEGYGFMPDEQLAALANFAHDYKRIVQGNVDQFSMFTGKDGWTPPTGWIVRGSGMTVCSVGNFACIAQNGESDLTEVMSELRDAASA